MSHISAILFDKDGTLFDFHKTWGNWSRAFLLDLAGGDDQRARQLAEAVDFDIDNARYGPESILISATPFEVAEALLPFLPGASPASIAMHINTSSASVPQAEATPLIPLLDELRSRGLSLGVATNDTEDPARAHLRESGIHDHFTRIYGCDSGYRPKPEPDMLLAFAELIGLAPERIVMVGDSAHDLKAAEAAGMIGVGVLTGSATRGQLAPLAEEVLPSIAGLPRWLDLQARARTAA